VSAALHKSVDGTRVVNDMRVRSVEDWENLRKVSQTKGYFDRIVKFGTPDMYVHEVIDTRERAVS
jgi:predicted glycosyltransferase